MPKILKIKYLKIENWKLMITLKDLNSNKTLNITWPWINVENIFKLLKKNKITLTFEEFTKDIKECLKYWRENESFSEKLKDFLLKKYKIKINLIDDIEDFNFLNNNTNKIVYPKYDSWAFQYFNNSFVDYNKTHEDLLIKSLNIFSELINKKEYKELKKNIFFWGWTSLYFKYFWKFYRFSKDLDFSIKFSFNKWNVWLSNSFLTELINLIKKENNKEFEILKDNETRIINFLWQDWNKRDIKFDTMWTEIIDIEEINIPIINKKIKITSPLDTLCNKLNRQSEIDITDIIYILQKEKYTLEDIKKWLNKKAIAQKLNYEIYIWNIKRISKRKNTWKWLIFIKDL